MFIRLLKPHLRNESTVSPVQFNSIQDYLYSAFYDTIVAKQLYWKLSLYNRFIYCRNLIYFTYGKIWLILYAVWSLATSKFLWGVGIISSQFTLMYIYRIGIFLIDSQIIWWNMRVSSTTWSKRSQMKPIPGHGTLWIQTLWMQFKTQQPLWPLFMNTMTSPFSEP